MTPVDWINSTISAAAVFVSLAAFRRSRPRVRVELRSALIVGPATSAWHGRSGVFVEVTNNGASPVQLQLVELWSDVGRLSGEPNPHTAPLPCALEGNGGRATWLFDRNALRAAARRDGGEEQVAFRAVATSGRVRYRSRSTEVVHPLEPSRTPRRRPSLADRVRRVFSSWTAPRIQPEMTTELSKIDLDAGTYGLGVRNHGGGIARRVTLELMRDQVANEGQLERVGEPIAVPFIARRMRRVVVVPLSDEPGLTWRVRYRGRARIGVTAMTYQEANEIVRGNDG